MTAGLPDEDLSDLGTPNRGEGLADFFDTPADEVPAPADEPEAPEGTPQSPPAGRRDEPEPEAPRPPARTQRKAKRPTPGAPGTATVYLSESVRARLEDYRIKHRTTNLVVVFSAIEACGDVDKLQQGDFSQLQDVIKKAAVATGYSGGFFSSNPKAVRYVGGGGAPVQFKPTPEQARQLDEVGQQLGFESRSTWIAPLLNEFLPGRKDKR